MHWSYCSLALSHQDGLICSNTNHRGSKISNTEIPILMKVHLYSVSYQSRNSYYGQAMVISWAYPHNGKSYCDKMAGHLGWEGLFIRTSWKHYIQNVQSMPHKYTLFCCGLLFCGDVISSWMYGIYSFISLQVTSLEIQVYSFNNRFCLCCCYHLCPEKDAPITSLRLAQFHYNNPHLFSVTHS